MLTRKMTLAALLLLPTVGCEPDPEDTATPTEAVTATQAPTDPPATDTRAPTPTATRAPTDPPPTPTEEPRPTLPERTRPPRPTDPPPTATSIPTTEDPSTPTPEVPIEGGETCQEATSAGAGVFVGDTSSNTDDHNQTDCIAGGTAGNDVAFGVPAGRNSWLRARLFTEDFDGVLYLVGGCAGPAFTTCPGVAADVTGPGVETFTLPAGEAPTNGILMVDGVESGEGGPFRLEVSEGPSMLSITDVQYVQQRREGDDDGNVEPGEVFDVTVTLTNTGDTSVNGLAVSIDTGDALILGVPSQPPRSPVAADATVSVEFELQAEQAAIGTDARITVTVVNGGGTGTWVDSFTTFIGEDGDTPIPTPEPTNPPETPTQAGETPTQPGDTSTPPVVTPTPSDQTPTATRTPGPSETPPPTPTDAGTGPTPTVAENTPTQPSETAAVTPTQGGTEVPSTGIFPDGSYRLDGVYTYNFGTLPFVMTNEVDVSGTPGGFTGTYRWMFWNSQLRMNQNPDSPDCVFYEEVTSSPHTEGDDPGVNYATCDDCGELWTLYYNYTGENDDCTEQLETLWYGDGEGGLVTEHTMVVGWQETATEGWPEDFSDITNALDAQGYEGSFFEERLGEALGGEEGDLGPGLVGKSVSGDLPRLPALRSVLISSPAQARAQMGMVPVAAPSR